MASVPARYALERKRWSDAASPHRASCEFFRGIAMHTPSRDVLRVRNGQARGGNAAGAHADIEQLKRLQQMLIGQKKHVLG